MWEVFRVYGRGRVNGTVMENNEQCQERRTMKENSDEGSHGEHGQTQEQKTVMQNKQ